MKQEEGLKLKIREIKDFPKSGVDYKDITPILEDRHLFQQAIGGLFRLSEEPNIDKVVGIEARGFLFASAIAHLRGTGLVMVRKDGKLPSKTIGRTYQYEYGSGSLHMNADAINKGERVLIIDDTLATGGTAEAAAGLVEELGGSVEGFLFLVEMPLGGRERLKKYEVRSLLRYL